MHKFKAAALALALVVLGGCAMMPGSMVGTSAVSNETYAYGDYQPKGAWADQVWNSGE